MLASCCVHPIDLAKVRLQLFATVNPTLIKPSFPVIISGMIKKEGFFSIYSGLSAALMRQAVYGTARIGLFRKISDELVQKNEGKPLSFVKKTLAGMAAGSIAVCVGTPFDVTLVRMQADSMKDPAQRRGYKNVFDALARVAREEGFSKLYSGLLPNIMRGMAMNVGMLACYDQVSPLPLLAYHTVQLTLLTGTRDDRLALDPRAALDPVAPDAAGRLADRRLHLVLLLAALRPA